MAASTNIFQTLMKLSVLQKTLRVFVNEKVATASRIHVAQSPLLQQQSQGLTTWQTRRDWKRRQLVKEYGPLRLRTNALRKNELLPKELQAEADKEIAALPRDSCRNRLVNRCVLTGRPRGNLRKYRVSRIQWRLFADYNKLSGITRSSW